MENAVFWDIKNPVRTSQETHYVSATELRRLILCKIRDFQGGDYEECHLLGCGSRGFYKELSKRGAANGETIIADICSTALSSLSNTMMMKW
jgi:hypothetical protein